MHMRPSLAATAAEQGGVVSLSQALAGGLDRAAVHRRVASGRWQRIFPRVYATFSGPLPPASRLHAALLYAGAGAVLSHVTAAALHGWRSPHDASVHVTVSVTRRVAPQLGLVVHRSRRPPAGRGSPARTAPERTVVDCIHLCTDVADAIAVVTEALRRRSTTADRLAGAVQQHRGLRHRGAVLTLLTAGDGVHSPLEAAYAVVERAHGLPVATRQRRRVSAGRVTFDDIAYDEWGVVVELDGRLGHEEADGRFRDMARDNAHVMDGRTPLRFGWRDVLGSPCAVAAVVTAVLRRNGWRGKGVCRTCGGSVAA